MRFVLFFFWRSSAERQLPYVLLGNKSSRWNKKKQNKQNTEQKVKSAITTASQFHKPSSEFAIWFALYTLKIIFWAISQKLRLQLYTSSDLNKEGYNVR